MTAGIDWIIKKARTGNYANVDAARIIAAGWSCGGAEAYVQAVVADYERRNFSVSQALFPPTSLAANLLSIYVPESNNGTGGDPKSDKDQGLLVDAIVGIVVGAIAILAIAIIAGFLWRKKKQQKHYELADTGVLRPGEKPLPAVVKMTPGAAKPEIEERGIDIYGMNEHSLPEPELPAYEGQWGRHEPAQEQSIHELADTVYEIDGNETLPQKTRRFSWEI